MNGSTILFGLVFYPIIGALVSYLIGRYHKKARDYFADFITVSELICFLVLFYQVAKGTVIADFNWENFCGRGIHFSLDGFRVLYGSIAAFMWAMTTIFSKEYFTHYRNRNRYYLFNLLTLGATVGVFLSADLYTTFIFFEMMSFTSYVWVAQDERKESLRAAETYLAVAVIGGLVMLMGIFLLYDAIGTLEMSKLLTACAAYENKARLYVAGICMLFGFGAKAGAFPLHIWLPKAHPVAPAPASALLSGILTKSGVFGILVISCNIFLYDKTWGYLILALGVCTMFGGALLAVFSIDLKRTLACSSMSQIGFILIGIGMQCLLGAENALAVRGSLLHMVNHSLIKLVLFMIAGVVYMNLHKLDLNSIRGFGRRKPLLNFAFLMGALGIGGIPLWNGYVSKTLIHESIVEYILELNGAHMVNMIPLLKAAEWIFLISGGLTIAYMMKLYIAIFIEKNNSKEEQQRFEGMNQKYMNSQSAFAIAFSAILLPVMGFFSKFTMNRLADLGQGFMQLEESGKAVNYFSLANLKGGMISILIGVMVYVFIIRICLIKKNEEGQLIYINAWPKWLDLEELIYRPVLLKIVPFIAGVFSRICDSLVDWLVIFLRKTIYRDRKIPCELPEGNIFTHITGTILNFIYSLFHKGEKKTGNNSYVHIAAVKREEIQENAMIIQRSMSFGLIMFCFGLCLTLIYLLYLK
ncbi:MAG: complex I subunit 5 family protein [Lachnospiraceae bacterium]|nr:complex I subunit 5 family protein [Lachnospiraceae bacterium]